MKQQLKLFFAELKSHRSGEKFLFSQKSSKNDKFCLKVIFPEKILH